MGDDKHRDMDVDVDTELQGHPDAGAEFGADLSSTSHPAEAGPSSSSSPSSDSTPNSDSEARPDPEGCTCSYCTRLDDVLDVATVSDAGLRYNAAAGDNGQVYDYEEEVEEEEEDATYDSRQKGKEVMPYDRVSHMSEYPAVDQPCFLIQSLPVELIDNILSYLSPIDLAAISQTCRFLYLQAGQDRHWQALVQANVPGITLTSPYPFASFRELYAAHDPRWFLTKHKIWFSGHDLTGKLIMVRFNPSTGGMEGHQMVAVSNRSTYLHWPADDQVIIHSFEPEVRLHMHKPVLNIPANASPHKELVESDDDDAPAIASPSRFATETTMLNNFGAPGMFSNFVLARPLAGSPRKSRPIGPVLYRFPYGNMWPPPSFPAKHRISTAQHELSVKVERPVRRAEISDQGFHIHSWLEMRESGRTMGSPLTRLPTSLNLTGIPDGRGRKIGEDFTTYSTLAPWTYTPTEDKPWRGIWVGDYSGHGCEFLLVHQPDDEVNEPPPVLERNDTESDEEFAQRQWEAKVYRGRLEAIKLTGDPNIPRGEYTFVADDLGENGFVDVVAEEPFAGARVVRSRGHVAHHGFVDDKYIESQLLLISTNRLAQYWVGFGHISFFERVDIDQFLGLREVAGLD